MRKLRLLIGAGVAALIALVAFAATSFAHAGRRGGVSTAGVSAAAAAAALKQATGLTPAQVTTKHACGSAAADSVRCYAEVVVSRTSGRAVRAKVSRENLLAQSKRSKRTAASTVSAADSTSATSEPVAGSPGYLQEAYDLTWLSEHKGSGVTIAIVDAYDDPDALSDMMKFRAEYGLPACNGSSASSTASNYASCFQRVSQSGSTSSYPLSPANDSRQSPTVREDISGWVTEESLDLDAISTTCPLCTIDLVEANSDSTSNMNTAVAEADKLGAKIISLSWGGGDEYSDYTNGTETVTFAGVSTLAASGDSGTSGVSADDPNATNAEQYPSALPGVVSVGGTSVAAATATARGFGESVWNSGESGGSLSATGSGCDTSVPRPSWQSVSMTGCSGRAYNDIAADGDPATGLAIYDSYDSSAAELVGGTSLATPLLAGYEAVTGLGLSSSTTTANSDGSFSPEWTYQDISGLNDITSGSDGSCTVALICDAASGWDGPSGNGSMSGDLVSGGPGIGGAYVTGTTSSASGSDASNISATGATLTSGVYPNGLDTSVWWQYGTSTDFGQTVTATDGRAGTAAVTVAATLTCLAPDTTYYYRAVAANGDGTTYGYTYSFTTLSGSASSTCTGTGGSGTTTTTNTTTTTSTTATNTTTTSTTTSATTTGSTSSSTKSATPAPSVIAAAKLSGTAEVGDRVYVTGGSFKNVASKRVLLQRCLANCVTIAGAGSGYKLAGADAGAYIRAYEVLSGAGGTRTVAVTGLLGPVRSGATTASTVKAGTVTVKLGTSALRVRTVVTRGQLTVRLAVTRGRAKSLRVWVYKLSGDTLLARVSAPNLSGTLRIARASGQRFVLVLRKL